VRNKIISKQTKNYYLWIWSLSIN